jgi:hypothetical protein
MIGILPTLLLPTAAIAGVLFFSIQGAVRPAPVRVRADEKAPRPAAESGEEDEQG